MVNTCLEQGKPVIIATHMLESMIDRAISMLRRASAVSAGDKFVIVSDIIAQDQTWESIQLRVVR